MSLAIATGALLLRTTFERGTVGRRILELLGRLPFESLRGHVRERRSAFVDSDRQIGRFFRSSSGDQVRAASWVFVAWFLESCETYLFSTVLGARTTLPAAMAVESLAVLLRHVFVLLPAGLGAQELGYVALMSATGMGGQSFVAAFAVLKRAKELVWCALGYALLIGDRRAGRRGVGSTQPAGVLTSASCS